MTGTQHLGRFRRVRQALLVTALVTITAACGGPSRSEPRTSPHGQEIRTWTIHYRAHNGADRLAYVVLPAWYGPRANPPLPAVISPHGRNANGRSNAKYFENLPAIGTFAIISPDGMGRRLGLKSYAYGGQIDDLARMPELAEAALPWLRIDRQRIYALGSSMGGQETLMLVARHPRLLAGAAAMDSVTDLVRRYGQLPQVECDESCRARWGQPYGRVLQAAMRREVGGTPWQNPRAYEARSAAANARRIAYSRVPLQIWWSETDAIVVDQAHQSAALFDQVLQLNPCAPVSAYAGRWKHSSEMRAASLLPIALAGFDLRTTGSRSLPRSVRYHPVPSCAGS